MNYTKQEVMQYVDEEDIKFIRLTFCDVFGKPKNVSIMSGELERAFQHGIAIDAWSITGFDQSVRSDLFLHPDPATLSYLPWRPESGGVVRMFCDITWPDGSPFECDTRFILKQAVSLAESHGLHFQFGAEMEFYLFQRDENGHPTHVPYDKAGYMDMAPDDKGENIRREICLTLEQMGIHPESSHHEEGPGQNEIDFKYSDPLTAADNAITFSTVVKTIANGNGLYADFSPKPLENLPGNGMHINISAHSDDDTDIFDSLIAGILEHISDITVFLNPAEASYSRFGTHKAPFYISWSEENRSQLIRIPALNGTNRRAELRSSDPTANPYLSYALLIYACMAGIDEEYPLPPAMDMNLYTASEDVLAACEHLPASLQEAKENAVNSRFVTEYLPHSLVEAYCHDS